MSRPVTWCPDKASNLLYFDQAARAYLFSPDKFLTADIKEPADKAPHAYVPFRPAVKSGQPHFIEQDVVHHNADNRCKTQIHPYISLQR